MKRIGLVLGLLLVLMVSGVASATTVKHPKINMATPLFEYDYDYHGYRTQVEVVVGLNAGGSTAWARGQIWRVWPNGWHTTWVLYPSGGFNSSQQAMWDKFYNYTVAAIECDSNTSSAVTAYNSTTTHQTSLITIYDYADVMATLRYQDNSQCELSDPPPNP